MGDRTPDLVIANDALYQLSYEPNMANEVPRLHRLCETLRAGLPDAHFRFTLKVRARELKNPA